jgi:hypothetical protein
LRQIKELSYILENINFSRELITTAYNKHMKKKQNKTIIAIITIARSMVVRKQ